MSPSPAGTKHLQFLTGHGAVLRVNMVWLRINMLPLTYWDDENWKQYFSSASNVLGNVRCCAYSLMWRAQLLLLPQQGGDLQLFV